VGATVVTQTKTSFLRDGEQGVAGLHFHRVRHIRIHEGIEVVGHCDESFALLYLVYLIREEARRGATPDGYHFALKKTHEMNPR